MVGKIIILFALLLLIYFIGIKLLGKPVRELEIKKAKKNVTMVCPNCGSTNVKSDLSTSMISWGGSTRWICKDCHHSASFFLEMNKSNLNIFKKEISKRSKEQEKIINSSDISKAFIKKRVSFWVLIYYLMYTWVIPLFVFGLFGGNYLLIILGLFLLLVLLIIGILIKRRNRRIEKNEEKKR